MSEPWKERFRARKVHWTLPSPLDRRRAIAMSDATGQDQLYAWAPSDGEARLRQLTDRPDGTAFGHISGDGEHVLYLDDDAGNELGHYVRVPFDGGEPEDITPDLQPYAAYSLRARRGTAEVVFTASSDSGHETWLVDPDAAPSERCRLIHRTDGMADVAGITSDGQLVLIRTNERTGSGRFSLVLVETASGAVRAELWDGPESSIEEALVSPLPDDHRVVASSDTSGVLRPFVWDPGSGERRDLPLADIEGEVVAWDWSPDGGELLLCNTRAAVQQLYIYELASDRVRRLDHPPGTYGLWGGLGVWFGPRDEIIAQWQDSVSPAQVIGLDRTSGRRTRSVLPAGAVPPGRSWRSVSFPGEDGEPLQAWLATPTGDGPFPAVIETHGGPEGVTTDQFLPRGQIWTDHGFAYLNVNYHGSTTFGRAFKESIWGRIGELEVADVVAARRYLVDEGLAVGEQVFLTGWSYGGYITLHALGRAPGLWAGGMAGVAVADWVAIYGEENESLRAYDRAVFGGPPGGPNDQRIPASPITHAATVDAPVLVIQGRNDTRCPAGQLEGYERRMRELGKSIEIHWFDAGHVGGDVERDIEHMGLMLAFAQRVLADGTE